MATSPSSLKLAEKCAGPIYLIPPGPESRAASAREAGRELQDDSFSPPGGRDEQTAEMNRHGGAETFLGAYLIRRLALNTVRNSKLDVE
ncbi:hypothetical protein EYF80_050177 [Liparis tanakae]|uniref:Uncharacterized protein n=1 Tax=Liparis tanakae TaxID=230148 RepID=A0A4Z2FEI1_9TELE|nr:hypothetical protein EYF80_050177 [Liparis tanakae]